MQPDVVIIGAGVAGLAAAGDLVNAAKAVVILEARNRLGGRIHTDHDPAFPCPIELGAEFVHGRPADTWDIIRASGLTAIELCDDHWKLIRNRLVKAEDFWEELDVVMARLPRGKMLESFADFTARVCRDKPARRELPWAKMYVEGFNAADSAKISVQSLAESQDASEKIDGNTLFRILGGYDRLVEAMASKLRDASSEIHVNTVVSRIRWAGERIEVYAPEKKFEAHKVLITVPLGVLQAREDEPGSLKFDPPISPTIDAGRRLAMGPVIKAILRFDSDFWETEKLPALAGDAGSQLCFMHAPGLDFHTWWTMRPLHTPILIGWAGGPPAQRLAGLDDSELLERAVGSLAKLFGKRPTSLAKRLQASRICNWQKDPFSRGAYSYVPAGGETAMRKLAQPIGGKLFFAGEATHHGGLGGTVAGAIASGHRAAKQILKVD